MPCSPRCGVFLQPGRVQPVVDSVDASGTPQVASDVVVGRGWLGIVIPQQTCRPGNSPQRFEAPHFAVHWPKQIGQPVRIRSDVGASYAPRGGPVERVGGSVGTLHSCPRFGASSDGEPATKSRRHNGDRWQLGRPLCGPARSPAQHALRRRNEIRRTGLRASSASALIEAHFVPWLTAFQGHPPDTPHPGAYHPRRTGGSYAHRHQHRHQRHPR